MIFGVWRVENGSNFVPNSLVSPGDRNCWPIFMIFGMWHPWPSISGIAIQFFRLAHFRGQEGRKWVEFCTQIFSLAWRPYFLADFHDFWYVASVAQYLGDSFSIFSIGPFWGAVGSRKGFRPLYTCALIRTCSIVRIILTIEHYMTEWDGPVLLGTPS